MPFDMPVTQTSTNHEYFLNHDATEHERLVFQHHALVHLMHGQAVHVPLVNPMRILDVGCGTGVMTELLARRFPAAQVIGVDIAPVPESPSKPENVSYIQGSFHDLYRNGSLEKLSFDLVFSRMLVFGMQDWPGYVRGAADLLKPGGWVEMQDLNSPAYDRNDKPIAMNSFYLDTLEKLIEARGMSAAPGSHLPEWMESAGLKVMGYETFPWVYKSFQNQPNTELMAQLMADSDIQLRAIYIAIERMTAGGHYSQDDIDRMKTSAKELWTKAEDGDHMRYQVCYAQKPL